MQYTEHLALKKPEPHDYININDLNDNADQLDAALKKLAAVTPPQEYDLPLAEGWELDHNWDKNCYYKTKENVVIVNFSAKNNSAVDPGDSGYILGFLPEGFRPTGAIIGVCEDYNYAGNSFYPFWIHSNGSIVIFSPEAPLGVSGTAIFVAAG